MGSKEGHLKKAEHNNKLLNIFNLRRTRYLDWVVVIIFYEALHYVDAYLATKGFIKIESHKQRNELIERFIPSISNEWWLLFNESQYARYEPGFQVSISDVINYKNIALSSIKSKVLKLLA